MTLLGAAYLVPQAVLDATGDALRAAGEDQLEGVVLWIGQPARTPTVPVAAELVPPQIAYRAPDGVAVQIPDDVIAEIISALPSGYAIVARVHSHPGRAYHSQTDDDNPLLSHQGAISIVVPHFGRAPICLSRCSVNERDANHCWRELSARQTRRRFRVT